MGKWTADMNNVHWTYWTLTTLSYPGALQPPRQLCGEKNVGQLWLLVKLFVIADCISLWLLLSFLWLCIMRTWNLRRKEHWPTLTAGKLQMLSRLSGPSLNRPIAKEPGQFAKYHWLWFTSSSDHPSCPTIVQNTITNQHNQVPPSPT